MNYVRENDDLRPEIPRNGSGTITVWPKLDGLNTTADAGATYTVHDPAGVQVANGTVDPTAVQLGGRSVSRFDVTISGLSTLDEDYQFRLTWTDTATSRSDTALVLFDVAAAPLGELVSLTDLLPLEVGVADTMERAGTLLGYAAGQTAQEAAAAEYAALARQTLEARLQSRAQEDAQIRPAMLLDRRAVRRVERQWALMHAYSGLRGDDEGEDPASRAFRKWKSSADAAFASLRIKYSTAEDLTPTATTSGDFGAFSVGR